MTVTYDTIANVKTFSVPSWNYTWPATAPCSHSVLLAARTYGAPDNVKLCYEPEYISQCRDIRHLNGRRPGNPPFGVTPRYMSTITVRNYLLKRKCYNTYAGNHYKQFGTVPKINGGCVNVVDHFESTGVLRAEWDVVTHQYIHSTYNTNMFDESEVSAAITSVQDEASVSALTSYDILTECVEAREIPGLVRSISSELLGAYRGLINRHSLSDLRHAARLRPSTLLRSSSRALRRLADDWMRQRYGIMPLAYSYSDIKKTLKRGYDQTNRSTRVINPTPTGVSLPSSTSLYNWTEYVGTITVRATVFQHFDHASTASFSGLGFNPLVTAWEEIPYSFVADWFVNVGDYITRKTTPTMSKTILACVSQRRQYSKKTWAHFKNESYTFTPQQVRCTPWVGAFPPSDPQQLIELPEESQLLSETLTNSYNRWIFPVHGAQLSFSPSVSWRRGIDSAVMTSNLLRTLIRYLRR